MKKKKKISKTKDTVKQTAEKESRKAKLVNMLKYI